MTTLSNRFEEAFSYATRLHAGQYRKDTTVPYVAHLLGVASLVLEGGGDEDQAIAALLHDAVEDQGGKATLEEIRRRFGETVAAIVEGCTDAMTIPKPPWRERKEAYIVHLRTASAPQRLVSAADKLHNARAILADYRALVEAFCAAGPTPLVAELERVVSEIERLASKTQDEGDADAT